MATSATFPNGIAAFSEKRDLLDDVDAADINKMQAEIVAIQSVLGPLPNEIDEVQAEVDQNTLTDQANLTNIRTSFANLSAQLTALRMGTHIPVFQSTMGRAQITSDLTSTPWAQMKFPKPAIDTHSGYSGYGYYRAPKSGFWIAQAVLNFKTGSAAGTYETYINVGGQPAWSIDTEEHEFSNTRGVALNAVYLGYAKRGTSIAVYVNQNSGSPQILTSAMFSAALLREL